MWKRVLLSVLLIVVVVGGLSFGASRLFSSQYHILLAAQQNNEITIVNPDEEDSLENLAAEAEQALKQSSSREDDAFENTAVGNTNGSYTVEASASAKSVSTSDAATIYAKNLVSDMTLSEKICQMLIVTPEVLTGYSRVIQTGNVSKNAYSKYPVGGLVYNSQNLSSQSQAQEMLEGLQSYALEATGLGLFFAVTEEGADNAVCASNLGTTMFDSMRSIGETRNSGLAYEVGSTQSAELTALGFNVNFAPDADVLTNDANTTIANRSFGSESDDVSEMVSQVVYGLTSGGMLSCTKYFPGIGSSGSSWYNGYNSTDITYEELQETDLLPFQAAIDAGTPMIMVSDVLYTKLDEDNPACLSPAIVTGILRNEMGFDGIIVSSALNNAPISTYYTSANAAVQAISAGCDMLLCVSSISSVINAVTTAVENGTIEESQIDASCIRILSAKVRYGIIPITE